jgi:hypothetical protein
MNPSGQFSELTERREERKKNSAANHETSDGRISRKFEARKAVQAHRTAHMMLCVRRVRGGGRVWEEGGGEGGEKIERDGQEVCG